MGEEVNANGGICLLDMRVRPGGSHHQKFVVLRHAGRPELDTAFVGGIDLCHSRRDDAVHAGDNQRQQMAAVYGNRPPWHDVQLQVRGPVVGDIETVFRERWEDPALLSRNPFHLIRDQERESGPGAAEAAEPVTRPAPVRGSRRSIVADLSRSAPGLPVRARRRAQCGARDYQGAGPGPPPHLY